MVFSPRCIGFAGLFSKPFEDYYLGLVEWIEKRSGLLSRMPEQGRVIQTWGNKAKVEVLSSGNACFGCPGASICQPAGEKGERWLEVVNEPGAKVGDRVLIEMERGKLFTGILLFFLFPMGMLLTGAILGDLLTHHQVYSAVMSGIFLGISLVTLYLLGRKSRKREEFQIRIIRVLNK